MQQENTPISENEPKAITSQKIGATISQESDNTNKFPNENLKKKTGNTNNSNGNGLLSDSQNQERNANFNQNENDGNLGKKGKYKTVSFANQLQNFKSEKTQGIKMAGIMKKDFEESSPFSNS